MIRDIDLAWLGGIIDGEGTIGNWKHNKGGFRRELRVTNTNHILLNRVKQICEKICEAPIKIYRENHNNSTVQAYRVVISRKEYLLKILMSVYPYLTAKAQKCEKTIEDLTTKKYFRNRMLLLQKSFGGSLTSSAEGNTEPSRTENRLGVCNDYGLPPEGMI